MNKSITIFFIIMTTLNSCKACCPQKMVVTSPVVSLRTVPKEFIVGQEPDPQKSEKMFGKFNDFFKKMLPPTNRDPVQNSQLLYNERIFCIEEIPKDWLKVKTIEQYFYNDEIKEWDYVPGFIKKDQAKTINQFPTFNLVICKPSSSVQIKHKAPLQLSMGTKLQSIQNSPSDYKVILADGSKGLIPAEDVYEMKLPITETVDTLRQHIIDCAKQLTGMDYCWGGRSALGTIEHGYACCPDCSGFLNIVYRATGFEIPRNSKQMFIKSNKIKQGKDLLPADCIFLSPLESPEKICHVLIYLGNNQVIESCVSKGVSIQPSNNRLGKAITSLASGDHVRTDGEAARDYIVNFGSFLNDEKLLNEFRKYAIEVMIS